MEQSFEEGCSGIPIINITDGTDQDVVASSSMDDRLESPTTTDTSSTPKAQKPKPGLGCRPAGTIPSILWPSTDILTGPEESIVAAEF